MALTNCRECQGTVSTEARVCPHCGCPNPAPASATVLCKECGNPMLLNAPMCRHCGCPNPRVSNSASFTGHRANRPPRSPIANLNTLRLWINGLILTQIFLTVVSILLMLEVYHAAPDTEALSEYSETAYRSFASLKATIEAILTVDALNLLALIVCAILFLVWSAKAHANLPHLGVSKLTFSPTWAVIGWIIPVAFFFVPFMVIQEIWKASDPRYSGEDWRKAPSSLLLWGWWILVILARLGRSFTRLVEKSTSDVRETIPIVVFSESCWIVAGILLVLIVNTITNRQQQKAMTQVAEAA